MSANDYSAFIAGLKRNSRAAVSDRARRRSPAGFSPQLLDLSRTRPASARNWKTTTALLPTYYAIDAVIQPVKSPAVMETIDRLSPACDPGSAGSPLDPSFEEQKEHHAPCKGVFTTARSWRRAKRLKPAPDQVPDDQGIGRKIERRRKFHSPSGRGRRVALG